MPIFHRSTVGVECPCIIPVNFIVSDNRRYGGSHNHTGVEGAARTAWNNRRSGLVRIVPVHAIPATHQLRINGTINGYLVLRRTRACHIKHPCDAYVDVVIKKA